MQVISQDTERQRFDTSAESERHLAEALRLLDGERARIADDLHDVLGAELNALRLTLENLARTATESATRPSRTFCVALSAAAQRVGDIYAKGRALVYAIGAEDLGDGGLRCALRTLGTKMSIGGLMHVGVEIDDSAPRMDSHVEIELLRFSQEALSNAAQHSGARVVKVMFGVEDGTIGLYIQDDGRGFDVHAVQAGFGLAGLRARARGAGGICMMRSAPGHGTTVIFERPA